MLVTFCGARSGHWRELFISTQAKSVRGQADMSRQTVAWLLVPLLLLLGVADAVDPSTDLDAENFAGKLVFYQMDGNATYVRDTGELASDIPTETMFELFDPQKNYRNAKFSYTWDLGNGEVIQGTEPVVRYHYAASGNYTLQLKVGVNVTQYVPPFTEVYSMEVQVLDAIKHIELKGPMDYEVSQNSSLAVHVDGSPPMWVCWRFLPNCVPDPNGGCTLIMLYENTLWLNHTFTSTGVQCLDISVRNDISKMQTSFSLFVKRSSSTHLIFILACAAILVATFSFIAVIACRPRHVSKAQLAASSNALFLKSQDSDTRSQILFKALNAGREEKEPLLL